MAEQFITIRDNLIALIKNEFTGDGIPALGGRVTAGRVLPIGDPYAVVPNPKDAMPLAVVALQSVTVGNTTRNTGERNCEYQVDLIYKADMNSDTADIDLDIALDTGISKIIDIVQRHQTFTPGGDGTVDLRNEAEMEVEQAGKRYSTPDAETLVGVASVTIAARYLQQFTQYERDDVEGLGLQDRTGL